jgi:Kef-type K+ transport system membrane component KefB
MIFGYLFLICLAGQIGVYLSGIRKMSVPVVIGEIAAGIVIGATGFGLLPATDPTIAQGLSVLSTIGFAMLMFMVGTHLPLRDPGLRKALGKSCLATACCFALAVPVAYVLVKLTGLNQLPIFVLLLANSSSAVVMPIVHERKLGGPVVLLTTTWVAIADTITIVALPLALAPGKLVNIGIGAAAVTVLAAISFVALKKFRATKVGDYFRERSKAFGHALDFRQSLTVLFGLSYVAYLFGVSFLVSGFAAGAIVALIGEPKRFTKQLIGAAEGFFVPLFFVLLGAQLDFRQLLHSPTNLELAALIAGGTMLVHIAVAKLPFVKLPAASGLSAAAQLGLPAAVTSLGLANGMLQPVQGAAIIAASMLSLLICTVGTSLLQRFSVAVAVDPAVNSGSPATCSCSPGHDD